MEDNMRTVKVIALLFLSLLLAGCGPSEADEILACDGPSPKQELINLIVEQHQEPLARQTLSEMEFANEPQQKSGNAQRMVCKAELIMYSPWTEKNDTYPVTYILEQGKKDDEFFIELNRESKNQWKMLGGFITSGYRQKQQYEERQREKQAAVAEIPSHEEFVEDGADVTGNGYDSEAAAALAAAAAAEAMDNQ